MPFLGSYAAILTLLDLFPGKERIRSALQKNRETTLRGGKFASGELEILLGIYVTSLIMDQLITKQVKEYIWWSTLCTKYLGSYIVTWSACRNILCLVSQNILIFFFL